MLYIRTVIVCSMLFSIVKTHQKGVRLTRAEVLAAMPTVGNLVLSDWLQGNAANRAIRVANLKHPSVEYYPDLLQPLFDPVLVRMTKAGFLLIGNEIHAERGETIEFVQGWWARFYGE